MMDLKTGDKKKLFPFREAKYIFLRGRLIKECSAVAVAVVHRLLKEQSRV